MEIANLSGTYVYYIVSSKASGSLRYWTGKDWDISLSKAKHYDKPTTQWDKDVEWLMIENNVKVSLVPTPSQTEETINNLIKSLVIGEN